MANFENWLFYMNFNFKRVYVSTKTKFSLFSAKVNMENITINIVYYYTDVTSDDYFWYVVWYCKIKIKNTYHYKNDNDAKK